MPARRDGLRPHPKPHQDLHPAPGRNKPLPAENLLVPRFLRASPKAILRTGREKAPDATATQVAQP